MFCDLPVTIARERDRLRREGDGAYLVIGSLLGVLGGAAMSGFDLELGAPFVVAGAVAGAAAAFGFRRAFRLSPARQSS